MRLNVSIGGINTEYYGLCVDELDGGTGLKRPKPQPKTEHIDVPGMSGLVDVSALLTGFPVYENIKLEITIGVPPDKKELWTEKKDEFFGDVVGKKKTIRFSDDAGHHYIGRVSIDDYEGRALLPNFKLIVDAEPFRWEDDNTEVVLDQESGLTSYQRTELGTDVLGYDSDGETISASGNMISFTGTAGKRLYLNFSAPLDPYAKYFVKFFAQGASYSLEVPEHTGDMRFEQSSKILTTDDTGEPAFIFTLLEDAVASPLTIEWYGVLKLGDINVDGDEDSPHVLGVGKKINVGSAPVVASTSAGEVIAISEYGKVTTSLDSFDRDLMLFPGINFVVGSESAGPLPQNITITFKRGVI